MYKQGYLNGLRQLNLEKLALTPIGMTSKLGPTLRNFGQDVLTNVIGSPKKFWGELRAGTALGKDSILASGFKAPELWQKGLMYGLPAAEAVQVARSAEPDKAGALGGILGGTLLGTAAFGPAGMLGSIPASFAGEAIGSRVVRGAKKLFGVGNQPPVQYTSLQQNV
jgi:hypothetical protein